MYKRTYGLKQICNIVVYIAHTACTIHLLNLPGRNPERDIVHGLRNLEEMADGWLAARRTLRILDISANKWHVKLPAEAVSILERTHAKWGSWGSWDQPTSPSTSGGSPLIHNTLHPPYTYPERPQSPGNPIPSGPHGESLGPTPVNMMGVSTGPQYPNATMPRSVPPMGPARQMPAVTSQRADYESPEPAYAHPVPQVNYQVSPLATSGPSAAPSPVAQSVWYGQSGSQVGPTQSALSPNSNSSVSGFDGTDHLVEESQDWWNRNAAVALGLGTPGVENWGVVWNTPVPSGQSSHMSYDSHGHPVPMMAHQHSSPTVAGQEAQMTDGLSSMASPAENRAPGYDSQWT